MKHPLPINIVSNDLGYTDVYTDQHVEALINAVMSSSLNRTDHQALGYCMLQNYKSRGMNIGNGFPYSEESISEDAKKLAKIWYDELNLKR